MFSARWIVDAPTNTRRDVITKTLLAGTALPAPAVTNAYDLPDLPYAFDALEPYIDAPVRITFVESTAKCFLFFEHYIDRLTLLSSRLKRRQ